MSFPREVDSENLFERKAHGASTEASKASGFILRICDIIWMLYLGWMSRICSAAEIRSR